MTKARILADMISDGVIGTTELADDAITPVKLDETGNYTIAQLGVNGTITADGLTVDGAVVFNEASADVDFRVESNGNANMLFVDGGNNAVGIGTALPQQPLHIHTDTVNGPSFIQATEGDGGDPDTGVIFGYEGDGNYFTIKGINEGTVSSDHFVVQRDSGNVGIGNTTSGYLFTSDETRLAVGDGAEHAAIQIYSGTGKWGGLEFADDATNGVGQGFIGYYHPSDYMQFNTNGSERMRINSTGAVTTPSQPSWNLRPNTNNTVTHNDDIIGWTTNTALSSSALCHIQGVTLSGSNTGVAGATSSGRINFPVAGVYKVWITFRYENTPGTGNIYLNVNGTTVARQHVEVWGRYNFAHGFMSQILKVSANDYIEWRIVNGGQGIFHGYGDKVNWCGGYLIG
jgi:prepilin-type processing-associated H-X9-DG protein